MQPIIFALRMIDDFNTLGSVVATQATQWVGPDTPIYIYTLNDETGVRYIGQTNNLSIRLSSHNCNARYGRDKTKRGQWIKSLLDRKDEPIMVAIERCRASASNQRERYWINYYREQGVNLVNGSRWDRKD